MAILNGVLQSEAERAAPGATFGVVVIGRNEALRLADCLRSVVRGGLPIVYVDSASRDGSAEMAESFGVPVIRLSGGGLTAARGRQAGFEYLLDRHADLQYVQFVDGDCVLDPEWLQTGAAFLKAHPAAAAVVGRLRERYRQQSLLIRLVDVDWDLPEGEIHAFGGIVMLRVSALRAAGGWRADLAAGEEADLSGRLRAGGWSLHRRPEEMTLHDIGIRTLGEYWRRAERSGFAYADLAVLHGRRERRWLRRSGGFLVYGMVLPVVALVAAWSWWPLSLLCVLPYVALVFRMANARVRRGDDWPFAAIYGLSVVLSKFAGAVGVLRYAGVRLSGGPRRLMEYKLSASAVR